MCHNSSVSLKTPSHATLGFLCMFVCTCVPIFPMKLVSSLIRSANLARCAFLGFPMLEMAEKQEHCARATMIYPVRSLLELHYSPGARARTRRQRTYQLTQLNRYACMQVLSLTFVDMGCNGITRVYACCVVWVECEARV